MTIQRIVLMTEISEVIDSAKRSQAPDTPSQFMVPHCCHYNNSTEDFSCCFNISSNKFHHLSQLDAQGKRICGSSGGWLIIVGNNFEIFMLNPLTRAQIQLPSVSSFLDQADASMQVLDKASTVLIHKAILVSNPDGNLEGYSVMVIYGDSRKLGFHKEGDHSWTSLQDAGSFYDDAVLCDKVLYAVNECGKVNAIRELGNSPVVEEMVPPWFFQGNKVYLVELDEELYIVIRFLEQSPDFGYRTRNFKVYEVDFYVKLHDRIRGIGEWAIFLGHNQSASLSTRRVEGLKENCIYFTDDNTDGYKDGIFGGHDTGVFHLDDGSIEPL
ncbi:unnamed protein product [Ilex paraguariensis]|uniref:KIB1-4 beta-propeller domain-containing protein n=1 Tax=Ilex paraguariensis TaxID=185542 RepID=A0ABC8UH56_9AQUA